MFRFWKSPSLWLLCGALVVSGQVAPASTRAQSSASEGVTPIDPIDIPPENDPLAHAFDRPASRSGYYLRLSSSIGVSSTRLGPAPWEGDGYHVRGFGSGFGLDAGYLVAPWVAVHLNTTLGVLWNGDIENEADILGRARGRARILAYGFAPAATFFTPYDFRFTTAFGVGLATIKTRSVVDTTSPGFYMNLVAGKDFVVSRNFSIGVQFEISYMLLSNDGPLEDPRVRQFLFGLSGAFDSI